MLNNCKAIHQTLQATKISVTPKIHSGCLFPSMTVNCHPIYCQEAKYQYCTAHLYLQLNFQLKTYFGLIQLILCQERHLIHHREHTGCTHVQSVSCRQIKLLVHVDLILFSKRTLIHLKTFQDWYIKVILNRVKEWGLIV